MTSQSDKNEPGRFLGEGVSFRAKLIGVLEVPEARGDRMCQEALADLKIAIRAAGEHKQRIQVHVAIDGLRLRDDKTGDSLYHHPVHKISFIAQDMTDSRAFGYIFGSPDTGHRFFGIKTDKAASQVVIAMRDLFQVVFELKKKEIELAKKQLECKNAICVNSRHTNTEVTRLNKTTTVISDSSSAKPTDVGPEGGVAELVDLEQELSSLRRGLTLVEGLTPSADPFGDSFIVPPQTSKAGLLPPPPSGTTSRGRSTPASSTPATATSTPRAPIFSPNKVKSVNASLTFELSSVTHDYPEPSPPFMENLTEPISSMPYTTTTSLYDVFTELDPLGTGRSKPYVDKKLFFQELKNPPKKVLKDLVPTTISSNLLPDILPIVTTTVETVKGDQTFSATTITSVPRQSGGSVSIAKPTNSSFTAPIFASDPFAETDPFDSADPFSDTFKDDPFVNSVVEVAKQNTLSNDAIRRKLKDYGIRNEEKSDVKNVFNGPLQVSLPPEPTPKSPRLQRQTTDTSSVRQRPQRNTKLNSESASPPPPLPPKKLTEIVNNKPPPRPPHEEHTDSGAESGPPLPRPSRRRGTPTADRAIKPRLSSGATNSSEDEYLTPIPPPLPGGRRFDITLSQLLTCGLDDLATRLRVPASTLSSMTLPQLTTYLRSYLAADAERANINVEPITKADKDKSSDSIASKKSEFKSNFEDDFAPSSDTNGTFVANFDDFDTKANPAYDRYAAFREIQEQELTTKILISPIQEKAKQNGEQIKQADDSDDEKDISPVNNIHIPEPKDLEKERDSHSPLKSLDELTLDSFNMFRNSVSPKPSQIDAKIEDIKSVMKNLQLEQSRRSVSPRDNGNNDRVEEKRANDRYAALREITITEPPEEYESLPSEAPKERKRSDEKSDGFDNSDFFDCIDNSSLSFSHVDDAFRKSPGVREKGEREVEKREITPTEIVREVPARLSTGSISEIASGSSPDTKERSVSRSGGGRWSVLAAHCSSDSKDSESAAPPRPTRRRHHCRSRHTSSSSRDVSPWDEAPPPPRHHRTHSHHRESRHNSSGSRDCLDSGSGRDKDKIRDKRDRDRDSRDSGSTRERDRRDSGSGRDRDIRTRDISKERDRRRKSRDREREKESWDRDYSRDRDYRDSRSRERLSKEYREKERDRHRKPQHSWDDEEEYSEGGGSGRSSPRERWTDHRWKRDERNYGSLGWRESRRRVDIRQSDDNSDRRYGATLAWANRRTASSASRRESDRRRARREDRMRPPERPRDQRFSNDFSPRDHGSPFDNDFIETPALPKKRAPYTSLEGTRFVFESEETTASPISGGSRVRDGESGTRFRFDSESVSPRSMFEDDFTVSTPRARAASIAEEDEGDLPPLRVKPPSSHRDIKKSESVNIFVRESDPFENDDFFACTGSDRAARRENWPGDFQAFDNLEESVE